MRTLARLGTLGFVALATVIVACGDKKLPYAGDPTFIPTNGSGSSNGGGLGGAATSTKPPGCGQKDDGSFCDCVDASLLIDTPNLYFVLDHSGSMTTDDKWDDVRVAMASLLRTIASRANFGATVFPGFGSSDCGDAQEILATRPGDPPSTTDGPTTTALIEATNRTPSGGTPTAAALRFVLPKVEALSGRTFVILATDGAPNCNTAPCASDQCQPNIEDYPGCPSNGTPNCCAAPVGIPENCLDAQPTIDAVTALSKAGIPTYVIGIPGSSAYASLLNQLAAAGGTAQSGATAYFAVDANGSSALTTALKKVAAKIVATCVYKLKQVPDQPDNVNIYLDEKVLPKDPVNGWKIEGDTVTLLGTACDQVMNGDVLDVRIIVGCPTVEPR